MSTFRRGFVWLVLIGVLAFAAYLSLPRTRLGGSGPVRSAHNSAPPAAAPSTNARPVGQPLPDLGATQALAASQSREAAVVAPSRGYFDVATLVAVGAEQLRTLPTTEGAYIPFIPSTGSAAGALGAVTAGSLGQTAGQLTTPTQGQLAGQSIAPAQGQPAGQPVTPAQPQPAGAPVPISSPVTSVQAPATSVQAPATSVQAPASAARPVPPAIVPSPVTQGAPVQPTGALP